MRNIGLACLLCIGCGDGGGAPGKPPDPNGVAAEAVIQVGGGPFTDLAINPDGMRMCIAGSEFGFYGLDGKCLPDGPPSVTPVACLAPRHFFYSLDAELLVYNEQWDMLGAATVTDPMAGPLQILRAATSFDGGLLAVAAVVPPTMGGIPITRIVQLNIGAVGGAAQGRDIATFSGTPDQFVLSPDGKTAVVPSGGILIAVDVASGVHTPVAGQPMYVSDIAWPAGGGLLVSGIANDRYRLFELDLAGGEKPVTDEPADLARAATVRTLEGGYLINAVAARDDYRLRVLDVHAPLAHWRWVTRSAQPYVAIAITPDGSKLYVLQSDKVLVYDMRALVTAPALPTN